MSNYATAILLLYGTIVILTIVVIIIYIIALKPFSKSGDEEL